MQRNNLLFIIFCLIAAILCYSFLTTNSLSYFNFLFSIDKQRASYAGNSGPYKVQILDVLGHGKNDLLFCFNNADAIAVLAGNGKGKFNHPIISEFPYDSKHKYSNLISGVHNFGTADLNGDGLPDLVMGLGGTSIGLQSNDFKSLNSEELHKFWTGRLVVAKNMGNGKFTKTLDLDFDSNIKGAQFASLRGKGTFDLIGVPRGSGSVGDMPTSTLTINLAKDNKNFEFEKDPISFDVGNNTYYMAVADMNNNGQDDLIVLSLSGYLSILESPKLITDLAKTKPKRYYFKSVRNSPNTNDIKIADLDGDGLKDIVTVSTTGKVIILFQKKSSANIEFEENEVVIDTIKTAAYLTLADLTNNGYPDIIISHFRTNKIGIIFNYGNRKFSKVHFLDVGYGPYGIDAGDLNGNGIIDIVTANPGSNTYSILFGKGNGEFYPAETNDLGLVLKHGKWNYLKTR